MPGTTYYADAANGDDSHDGRSPATALRTLSVAANKLAKNGGDRLLLKGSFRETLRLDRINRAANPLRPTVIQCAFDAAGKRFDARIDGGLNGPGFFPFDQRNLPPGFGAGRGNYLDNGITITSCNYVTVSGLEVRGIVGIGVFSWQTSHLRLEYLDVEWSSESGMVLSNGNRNDPMASDLSVAHCRLNHTNQGHWVNRASRLGFSMKTETLSVLAFDGFEIYANHLSNSLMEGIDFKFGARNGEIHNNVIEATRSAGIYANEGDDTLIYRNIVRNIGYYDPEDGSGLTIAADYLLRRLPWVSSISEHGATGILLGNGDLAPNSTFETGRCSGIRVYENVISWTRKNGISVWNQWRIDGKQGWQLDDIHIYNNVIHRPSTATIKNTSALQLDVGMSNATIRNNILSDSRMTGIQIWQPSQGNFFGSNVISHNLEHGSSVPGLPGARHRMLNPQFRRSPNNPMATFDFQLRQGSPAIDTGFDMGLATGGTLTDIGAYQSELPPWPAGIGSVR